MRHYGFLQQRTMSFRQSLAAQTLVLWIMVASQLWCDALLSHTFVSRTAFRSSGNPYYYSPPTRRRAPPLSMVAKSGGKIIESTEEFGKYVMSPESDRPVMVFYSAPWCVLRVVCLCRSLLDSGDF